MSDFFVGEIRLFTMAWAPQSWALCNGATLTIQQNAALYSLLGVQFGGDAKTTFSLPDFRGRAPVGAGTSQVSGFLYQVGKTFGVENVTLTSTQIPLHTHVVSGTTVNGSKTSASGNLLADTKPNPTSQYDEPTYATASTPLASLDPHTVLASGGASHANVQPSIVLNFCIATYGVYPPRP